MARPTPLPLLAPARGPRAGRSRVHVEQLLSLLDEAFDHKSWHGTTLRGSLRGLSAADATWRPGPGRHNVWEEAVHCAYWKYAARRRLTGERRGSFAFEGTNWFARPSESGDDWEADLRVLVEEHRQLRAAVEALSEADVDRPLPGKSYTRGWVIRGAAAHDLYHAGQIQLLKRLRRG